MPPWPGRFIWVASGGPTPKGYVAKDPESAYVAGRTLKWLKVKQPRYREGERGRDPRNKS